MSPSTILLLLLLMRGVRMRVPNPPESLKEPALVKIENIVPNENITFSTLNSFI